MIPPPLPIVIPLLAAAGLMVGSPRIPRWAADSVSILVAAGTTAMCLLLLLQANQELIVYWFAGWEPRQGIAMGIDLAIDPLGAGMAALTAALTTAALIFSWRYFDAVKPMYHALMLIFMAAMIGFSLTGDLFNLFVFLELMSVTAYALTGYKIEEPSALEGSIHFAVTNSIGEFLVLIAIALLYGRTGALNMAQVGASLAGKPVDGLVIMSLALLLAGLFVKGAIVPFHFWLSDAHAVAPSPVCVLFSGVMVELGLFGAMRVYWAVFHGALGPYHHGLGDFLLGAGAITAIIGAVMCFLQRHIKRLLAFSTISHMGMMLMGAAMLSSKALAGVAVYVLGHGLIKGGLFMGSGLLLHRFENVDELELHGKGRSMPVTALIFLLGGLGLAGLPPFCTGLGKTMMEEAAKHEGAHWVTAWFLIVSALTGGAVLRVTGRVFLGWGSSPTADEESEENSQPTEKPESETKGGSDGNAGGRPPVVMLATASALVVAALVIGVATPITRWAQKGGERFVDQTGYVESVMGHDARTSTSPPSGRGRRRASTVVTGQHSFKSPPFTTYEYLRPSITRRTASIVAGSLPQPLPEGGEQGAVTRHEKSGGAILLNPSLWIFGCATTLAAILLALYGLFRNRLPEPLLHPLRQSANAVSDVLDAIHSGYIGDYVLWLLVGATAFGACLAWLLR